MSWRCYSPGVPPSLVVGTADEAVVMQYVHAHMAWKVGPGGTWGRHMVCGHAECARAHGLEGRQDITWAQRMKLWKCGMCMRTWPGR
eukprot:1161578-Pelagomonas_calceolata.AAC.7